MVSSIALSPLHFVSTASYPLPASLISQRPINQSQRSLAWARRYLLSFPTVLLDLPRTSLPRHDWRPHPAQRTRHRARCVRRRHGNLQIHRAPRNHPIRQIGNRDARGLVAVAGGDDLDDLVARKGEEGDVGGVAGHQVAVEHAQYGLVRDDEEVVLLAFEFEDDGFEADGEVVVGLWKGGLVGSSLGKGKVC